ncbi:leucine-rich repeat-containing protein, partial [Tanacetum coccineum]
MRENIYFYYMHTHILFILSLVLLWFNTTTATSFGHQQLVAAAVGAAHTCIDKERQALLDFKASLHDPYDMLSTWRPEEEDDCCQWSGVGCNNQTGHVTALDLNFYYIGGELSLSLLNLTYLNHLDLFGNSFHGTISKFICSMTHLTFLNLALNEFTGTIPESIGSLTKLTWLGLAANNFRGVIPRSIGSLTKLTSLELSDNSFYGTIPREFGNLTNLEYLYLDSLGSCRVENLDWLSSLSSLEELEMDGTSLAKANNWVNVITGLQNLSYLSLVGCDLSYVMHPYSSSVNSSSSINYLFLQKNNLNSPMYSWLCPLFGKKLEYLDISDNTFDGNLLDFLKTLSTSATTLDTLDASSNQFTGSLSDEIQNFSFLKMLNLYSNQLNGTISDKLWQLPNLQELDLSFNNIRGKLPKSLSNHELYFIDLSFNCFYGPIPAFPARIIFLDLSRNKFHGQLPDCFRNLTYLKALNLGHNILSGRISPSIGY